MKYNHWIRDDMIENAMKIESERRARELEAATIAGFIGGLQTALKIISKEEGQLPEHPYDFLESIQDEITYYINFPDRIVKDFND